MAKKKKKKVNKPNTITKVDKSIAIEEVKEPIVTEEPKSDILRCYINGVYNNDTDVAGYGIVVFEGDKQLGEHSGTGKKGYGREQGDIAGVLYAALSSMSLAKHLGKNAVELYHNTDIINKEIDSIESIYVNFNNCIKSNLDNISIDFIKLNEDSDYIVKAKELALNKSK